MTVVRWFDREKQMVIVRRNGSNALSILVACLVLGGCGDKEPPADPVPVASEEEIYNHAKVALRQVQRALRCDDDLRSAEAELEKEKQPGRVELLGIKFREAKATADAARSDAGAAIEKLGSMEGASGGSGFTELIESYDEQVRRLIFEKHQEIKHGRPGSRESMSTSADVSLALGRSLDQISAAGSRATVHSDD